MSRCIYSAGNNCLEAQNDMIQVANYFNQLKDTRRMGYIHHLESCIQLAILHGMSLMENWVGNEPAQEFMLMVYKDYLFIYLF
jgi:hypothetical protein